MDSQIPAMTRKPPPILDFSGFRGSDETAKARLVEAIGEACKDKGFFQIINHGISSDLQERILAAAKEFFALPIEEKMKCHLSLSTYRRGYEAIGGQMLEPGSRPDTKEAIYLGQDLPVDHPRVLRGDYNCGPNVYPPALGRQWSETCMEYFDAMSALAQDVTRSIAPGLNLPESYFDEYTGIDPVATLRLIHYPPTPKTSPLERGIGAHRDFGCITLLLQDGVGGLQVQDEVTGNWLDVVPIPGAFVVNLGNLMARWTNHHYTSNTHRVLNFSDEDRYSVPFFFTGNASHTLSTIPGLEERRDTSLKKFGPPVPKEPYQPIRVREFLGEQFDQSYKRAEGFKPKDAETSKVPAVVEAAA